MIFNFFYGIFRGCRHYHLSRVFTLQEETYRVCLDCGTHIPYSPTNFAPPECARSAPFEGCARRRIEDHACEQ